jgi:hypothetical protein
LDPVSAVSLPNAQNLVTELIGKVIGEQLLTPMPRAAFTNTIQL